MVLLVKGGRRQATDACCMHVGHDPRVHLVSHSHNQLPDSKFLTSAAHLMIEST
jgi:hypothetical protein